MLLWNPFHKKSVCPHIWQGFQPSVALSKEALLRCVNLLLDCEDHKPHEASMYMVEPRVTHLDVAKGKVAHVVQTCSISSKEHVQRSFNENQWDANDEQDSHAHFGELEQQCVVQTNFLS